MLDGLLLIDKTGDCTSHDVVQRARRAVGQKKIGHCGTLDPTATGLLVLTLGKATRLTRFLIRAPKVYTGSVQFGQTTDTWDAAGEIVEERPTDGLTMPQIEQVVAGFIGEYEHLTPAYSAKKSGGVKRYEMARRGEEVPEERKTVSIYAFEATSALGPEQQIDFRLACGSGTYARSLAYELGEGLGCGAHLSALRRTEVGNFSIEDSATVGDLEQQESPIEAAVAQPGWIPFDQISLPFAAAGLDGQQERRILHGQTVLLPGLDAAAGDWIRLANRRQQFIAVGAVVELIGAKGLAVVQPKIVFT